MVASMPSRLFFRPAPDRPAPEHSSPSPTRGIPRCRPGDAHLRFDRDNEPVRQLIAGVSLGLLAVVEAVLRTEGAFLPIAILVAVCATFPVAFAPRLAAAAVITAAVLPTAV